MLSAGTELAGSEVVVRLGVSWIVVGVKTQELYVVSISSHHGADFLRNPDGVKSLIVQAGARLNEFPAQALVTIDFLPFERYQLDAAIEHGKPRFFF